MPAWFYCSDAPQIGPLELGPEESHHLARVCRLKAGDEVDVFDGRGLIRPARILAIRGGRARLQIEAGPTIQPEPVCRLTLATAVPKGDRFDWLVEKATELGVERLVPLITERSVVVPRGAKLDRLRRTIIEACKQCRRARLMVLDEPLSWLEAVAAFAGAARFLGAIDGRGPGDSWPLPDKAGQAVLAIGPEGGFTAAELQAADAAGWSPIRLGAFTLRVETAGLAGCAALLACGPVPGGPGERHPVH